MTTPRNRHRHKTTCRKGHAIAGDNRVVLSDDRSADGQRWLCRICHETPKKVPKAPAARMKPIEATRGSWGRQAPFINGMTPVMLADCQAALARLDAMEAKDPSIRGGARRRRAS